MARSSRKKQTKTSRKIKPTSVIALCATAGLFLGFGLGALMGLLLVVTGLGLIAGLALGYYVDSKNGIRYKRNKS